MIKLTPPQFPLGTCRATPAALELLTQHRDIAPVPLLDRHMRLDPGALSADGIELRLQAIEQGKRIFSLYEIAPGVLLRVITEADRSTTVICTAAEF